GGFKNIMISDKKGLSFEDAFWKVERLGNSRLILYLIFSSTDVKQYWDFSVSENGGFNIKAEISSSQPVNIIQQMCSFDLNDIYGAWKTPFEEGRLLAHQDFVSTYPIRWKNNKTSVLSLFENKYLERDHCMLFSVTTDAGERIMTLYKKKTANKEILCLNNSLIVPPGTRQYPAGRTEFFGCSISTSKTEPAFENYKTDGVIADLKSGSCNFIFDNGRVRMLHSSRELTKDFGVYSALRSRGYWIDSCQAVWKINRQSCEKLEAIGFWPFVPIEEQWEIGVLNEGEFSWDIKINVLKDVPIDIRQICIMLLPGYTHWDAGEGRQGEFPKEFTKDYDIMPYRSWYGDAKELSVKAKDYPEIVFSQDIDSNLKALIENTDNIYNARLILFQKTNEGILKEGNYPVFKGKIKIKV
ncbi:MAG TPA: hypothetical protein PLU24_02205, partial [Candidatus Omnitrophota bacterium]|nr:hypothetical protein [Candidatus Omnitrophota bacterium]